MQLISINPTVVVLPDATFGATVGVLVGRIGILACIEVGFSRVLRSCPLDELAYPLCWVPAADDPGRFVVH